MRGMASDLRLVWRQVRKSPGFAITAVLMLAFGIGATTAIFSIVDGVLLRPLPFPEASRLVTLGDQVSGGRMGENGDPGWVTAHEVVSYQSETRSFEGLGGYTDLSYELSGIGQPAQIVAARMTPSVFSVLGVAPLMGRVFTQQEDKQQAHVVVLSYAAWNGRFNANPRVIGTKSTSIECRIPSSASCPEILSFPSTPAASIAASYGFPRASVPASFRRRRTGTGISSWSGGSSPGFP